jgi:protein involved in ribonucleotide reduction
VIIYASRTGNVQYICGQLNLPKIEIREGLQITEPFMLATYTDGFGQVPVIVENFMEKNASYCKGIIVSGNRNFGSNFARAGDLLQDKYSIPVIRKLDLRGHVQDYTEIAQAIEKMGLFE